MRTQLCGASNLQAMVTVAGAAILRAAHKLDQGCGLPEVGTCRGGWLCVAAQEAALEAVASSNVFVHCHVMPPYSVPDRRAQCLLHRGESLLLHRQDAQSLPQCLPPLFATTRWMPSQPRLLRASRTQRPISHTWRHL